MKTRTRLPRACRHDRTPLLSTGRRRHKKPPSSILGPAPGSAPNSAFRPAKASFGNRPSWNVQPLSRSVSVPISSAPSSPSSVPSSPDPPKLVVDDSVSAIAVSGDAVPLPPPPPPKWVGPTPKVGVCLRCSKLLMDREDVACVWTRESSKCGECIRKKHCCLPVTR